MAVGTRVQNDAVMSVARLLHPGDDLPFEIALSEIDGQSVGFGPFRTERFDVTQRFSPIDFRLSNAEKV